MLFPLTMDALATAGAALTTADAADAARSAAADAA